MKKYFLLLTICFSQTCVQSQTIGWSQLNYIPSKTLYSVYCINYDTVIAVGANGFIIKTTNSGTSWDSIPSSTTNALYKISFVGDSVGYAVGEKGTILKTIDVGQTWSNIGINTNLNFFSLSFINKDTGWVAGGKGNLNYPLGNKGILLKTNNGGTSWLVDIISPNFTLMCFLHLWNILLI